MSNQLSPKATKVFNKAVKMWGTGQQKKRIEAMDTMQEWFTNTREQASLVLGTANEFPTWTPEQVLKFNGSQF